MTSIYQQQVAEMDRRHHLRVRVLSFIGAATLVIVILWSAGLPPTEWYTRLHEWLSRESVATTKPVAPVDPAAQLPTITTPADLAPMTVKSLPGTDSSTSLVPLPLYLISTSPGRNVHEGTARIGTSPENPQTYAAGAILANGARLAEIRIDYVVLERDRKSAKLYLKGQSKTSKQNADSLLAVGGAEPSKPVVSATREILTDYIRPSLVYDGDVVRGYQVYPGRKVGIFSAMGLRGGDVVTSIDGVFPADPAAAFQALNRITNGQAVVVTVLRDGRYERLTLDGALIAADQQRGS